MPSSSSNAGPFADPFEDVSPALTHSIISLIYATQDAFGPFSDAAAASGAVKLLEPGAEGM